MGGVRLHAVREDQHQARLQDHVLVHVLVLAGHHHHRLFAGDAPRCVVLVVAPVGLPRLKRGEACAEQYPLT